MSEGFAARLDAPAATIARVWILRRADGTALGFTDHDADLSIDGVTCRAASGWTAGASDGGGSLSASTASARGVLDSADLDAAALDAGALDGAVVEHRLVDWSAPEESVRLWTGRVRRIVRQGERFTAEIEGPLAALETVVGRTLTRSCDAILGDARCGAAPAPGQTCDKRFETCRDVFGNAANFRGFPDVPGDAFLTVWPQAGGRHDGGSRR